MITINGDFFKQILTTDLNNGRINSTQDLKELLLLLLFKQLVDRHILFCWVLVVTSKIHFSKTAI
jgi:hypothetical protein